MVGFLRTYQSDIMYVLSGICAMIAVFALITKCPSRNRKISLLVMTVSSVVLLISEVLGQAYFGVTTTTGYWMVRICNFLVYLMTLLVIHPFALYLSDLFKADLELPVPKRLRLISYITMIGEILVFVTPFTGLYYTIDEANVYHRSTLYPISYVFPLLAILLVFSVVWQCRKRIRFRMWFTLLMFAAVPLAASIIQFFISDVYVTDMAIAVMVVLLYIFTLMDTNRRLELAQANEIRMLKMQQEHTSILFNETAVALASAIDAKDKYTRGHSSRVAEYSRMIAAEICKNEDECNEIYHAALLHDVGKIGISDLIINKEGKLTEAEYDIIKSHTTIGYQILSEIKGFPYLGIAARHHHERFDGAGYPDGLKGKDIPEIARIIAVADAYDAMTSDRSYRERLSQEKVRDELTRCSGAQFDPEFAAVMLGLIEKDADFTMQER